MCNNKLPKIHKFYKKINKDKVLRNNKMEIQKKQQNQTLQIRKKIFDLTILFLICCFFNIYL